jgi:hypothetical protein
MVYETRILMTFGMVESICKCFFIWTIMDLEELDSIQGIILGAFL